MDSQVEQIVADKLAGWASYDGMDPEALGRWRRGDYAGRSGHDLAANWNTVRRLVNTIDHLASLALPKVESETIERCAKVAEAMGAKWGDPIGTSYQQGVNDQAIRIAGQIRRLNTGGTHE